MKDSSPNSILLSVIIPVYNTQQFLSRCFDSLIPSLISSHFKSEVIVVNDGSTDESLSEIAAYKDKYPQLLTVIDQKNGGLSAARNSGVSVARGRYIWFVDSDDLAESEGVPKILDLLSSVDADYFTINAARVDENNNICGGFSLSDHESSKVEEFDFSYPVMAGKFKKHMVWMRIYSREFISGLEFPLGITHEDIHFDIKVLSLKPRIYHTGILGYRHYFDNPDSITNNMNEKKFRSTLWVYQDLKKWIESRNEDSVVDVFRTVMFISLLRGQYYIFSGELNFKAKFKLAKAFQVAQKNIVKDLKLPQTIYKKEQIYAWLLKAGLHKLALFFIVLTA
ncbi:hypothetical protein A3762_08270 [Oleiphilus sp. HI0125]|uniref:glycosyltransferase n=1 Tax=Oleiphilus sp. HI0125 TaxID=1822266 RepID=UPI0007C3F7FC|nr:glycosyltransferase [Oleiphilus sp. HI0125]KZZ58211.1 hypothetical protein A3762_08270 [Oleiphilus sp. HI0125]